MIMTTAHRRTSKHMHMTTDTAVVLGRAGRASIVDKLLWDKFRNNINLQGKIWDKEADMMVMKMGGGKGHKIRIMHRMSHKVTMEIHKSCRVMILKA